jgi:predicted aspartyl protease
MPARPVVVPVEQAANVFFARVELNGHAPFWFTVDTGATLTVIDPATAGALGLPTSEAGERRDVGIGAETTMLRATRGVTIRVGGAEPFAPRRLFIVPVSTNAAALGHRVDGVLGTDFLSRYNAEFDFRRGRLVLHEGHPPVYPVGHAVAPMRVDANRPLVRAAITLPDETRVVASLLVDTGSSARSSFNSPFVRAHRLTRFPSLGLTATLGINGVTTASVVRLHALDIGGTVIDRPELALSSAASGMHADPTFDGILTTDLLGRFRVFVDYPGARLVLVR